MLHVYMQHTEVVYTVRTSCWLHQKYSLFHVRQFFVLLTYGHCSTSVEKPVRGKGLSPDPLSQRWLAE